MEMETQCCGMLHVFRLNLTPNQPEDSPFIRTYSTYIKDISIPVCYNAPHPPSPPPFPPSPERERESGHCWQPARLPNQSPLRGEMGEE